VFVSNEEISMDEMQLSDMIHDGLSLEQIANSVDRHPSTVSYWLAKYGLQAVNSDKHRARGAIERDELEALVDEGLSITELAEALDRSKATVRHWLRKYELKTLQATRRAQRRAVLDLSDTDGVEPPRQLVMQCREHGETAFVREGSGYYRCARCRSESVAAHRRRLKEQLVAEAGGRCVLCGYDRRMRALEFHHLDPSSKAFALSRRGITLSLEALRAEARKCVLLCSNCHAEVEDGHATVSIQ
jgi:transposase